MMRGKVTVPMAATGSAKDGWKLRWLAGTNPKGRTYDVQTRRRARKTWALVPKADDRRIRPLRPGLRGLAGAGAHRQGSGAVGLVAGAAVSDRAAEARRRRPVTACEGG